MLDPGTMQQIANRVCPSGSFVRAWPLVGGVSAQVVAFEVREAGVRRRLVVRCHGESDWVRDPDIATHEFALLTALYKTDLAVAAPVHLDTSCELLPTPYLVISFLEGETDAAPQDRTVTAKHMASYLARLHALDVVQLRLPFLADKADAVATRLRNRPAALKIAMQEDRIRDALDAAWPPLQNNRRTVLHGDYWPGNVLWRDGRIAAVIDWEDAGAGDPLADVANARLELLWAYGAEVMAAFTEEYLALAKVNADVLPLWDLCATLRPISRIESWGLDAEVLRRMVEQQRLFVDAAFDRLDR